MPEMPIVTKPTCPRSDPIESESNGQSMGGGCIYANNGLTECNRVEGGGVTYGDYLQLDRLLTCQTLQSQTRKVDAPDEHLFIVTHQVYELWFKQILFDLDIVRKLFIEKIVDEKQTLKVVSRLERIVKILKLLVDQVLILETMSALDFVEFRKFLTPASGFQSLQFRLLENKLGLKSENRVQYNQEHYKNVFTNPDDYETLMRSEAEPSLLCLLEKWLERTPGLESGGFNFWKKYKMAVARWLDDELYTINQNCEGKALDQALMEFDKTKSSFQTILNPELHDNLVARGERRMSHGAMQGALMVFFYRDQPRFSQPYQLLSLLMDVDSLMTKWRYNHMTMVQRMIGCKQGTGGSSGYHYLRSTCSDRYKVFLDLFNMSTFLIPRAYVPALSPMMERRLSCANLSHEMLELELGLGGRPAFSGPRLNSPDTESTIII